jgi:hypothetical protein
MNLSLVQSIGSRVIDGNIAVVELCYVRDVKLHRLHDRATAFTIESELAFWNRYAIELHMQR